MRILRYSDPILSGRPCLRDCSLKCSIPKPKKPENVLLVFVLKKVRWIKAEYQKTEKKVFSNFEHNLGQKSLRKSFPLPPLFNVGHHSCHWSQY